MQPCQGAGQALEIANQMPKACGPDEAALRDLAPWQQGEQMTKRVHGDAHLTALAALGPVIGCTLATFRDRLQRAAVEWLWRGRRLVARALPAAPARMSTMEQSIRVFRGALLSFLLILGACGAPTATTPATPEPVALPAASVIATATPAPPTPTPPQLTKAERDALRSELLAMMAEDQAMRAKLSLHLPSPPRELIAAMQEIDARNTARLRELLNRYGWPSRRLVGREAAEAAWLIAQHADADPAFQRRCLELMQALPRGEVDPRNLAYLTDRVLVAEGKPQIYGTQPDFVDGRYVAAALVDPERVDERRGEVGLGPLAAYIADLNVGLPEPTATPDG